MLFGEKRPLNCLSAFEYECLMGFIVMLLIECFLGGQLCLQGAIIATLMGQSRSDLTG